MKVLLITGSFPPMKCGVGDYAHHLAQALARDPNLQIAVLTSRAAEPTEAASFEVFPLIERWHLSELGTILRCVRAWHPDLVHMQFPTQGYGNEWFPWLLPLFLRFAGFPLVQTWHEHYPPRFMLRFLSKAVVPGGLVVVRDNYRQRLAPALRWVFWNKTMRIIPNASSIPAVTLSAAQKQACRARLARPNAHVIVYFGFIFPPKGVEQLFQIVNPESSHLVIIGDLRETDPYQQRVRALAESPTWQGRVTLTGFLPADEAACAIAAADAVVLPFLEGGGEWNTSLHGARLQGTFVLTTSTQRQGYVPGENTYYASPGEVREMQQALEQYVGRRAERPAPPWGWQSICESHLELYRALVPMRSKA